jgi:hypothetical protein
MNWTHMMLHHTAGRDCPQGKDWTAIRADHLRRGWLDVGYHFGLEFVNGAPTWHTGRPLTMQGAHCPQGGMNRKAVGIAIVGNFELAPPSPLLIDELCIRCIELIRVYRIPAENIVGHRDFKNTACPGKYFPMDYIKNLITAGLTRG